MGVIKLAMFKIIHYNNEGDTSWLYYKIANQLMAFSEPVKTLHEFEVNQGFVEIDDLPDCHSTFEVLNDDNSFCDHQVEVTFNNKIAEISLLRKKVEDGIHFAQINVNEKPACHLDFINRTIVVLNNEPFDSDFNIELITGPAMIMLLAHQSIFSLHSSAVTITLPNSDKVNVAFIAESGVGKSTLSKSVSHTWMQCSDDILPIAANETEISILDYPQLKLKNKKIISSENNNLNYIFNLNYIDSDRVVIEKMNAVDSFLKVVRHTVAARLFNEHLLQEHLKFAQKIIDKTPVFSLIYPRKIEQLPLLQKTLTEFLYNRESNK